MVFGITGQIVSDDFTTVNASGGAVLNLVDNDFTKSLYNPSGAEVSDTIIVTVYELGDGNYRTTFTPDLSGIWYLIIYQDTYFPAGKSGTIQIYDNDFDTISIDQKRLLGLVHENIYIDNTQFDVDNNLYSARLRIYENPSNVGTDVGVLATYEITTVTTGPGKFSSWKQITI